MYIISLCVFDTTQSNVTQNFNSKIVIDEKIYLSLIKYPALFI